MKTVMGILGLSILSAVVGVFAATELHDMAMEADGSRAAPGARPAGPAQPSQRTQQWVNH